MQTHGSSLCEGDDLTVLFFFSFAYDSTVFPLLNNFDSAPHYNDLIRFVTDMHVLFSDVGHVECSDDLEIVSENDDHGDHKQHTILPSGDSPNSALPGSQVASKLHGRQLTYSFSSTLAV